MAALAHKYTDKLQRIKKDVRGSNEYFKKNCDRFHTYRRYVFETNIDSAMRTALRDQGKPVIEFNILPAYVYRLLGEFAKHEPSIEVRPAGGIPIDPDVIKLVEEHIRHINYEANKNSCDYEVYKDLLSGGFSVMKVTTDYESPMSFNQIIKKERVFDPTLCGFDPMARHSHKGDGRYSFELYPKTLEDFNREYPGVDTSKVSFSRDIEGFNWSYLNNQQNEILLMGEFFEKKRKKARIVKLANNRVMTTKNYEKFEAWWESEGFIEQIPKPVGKSRMTDLEAIERFMVIESEVFDRKETDYTYLPHVFVDGSSAILQEGTANNTYQFTTPYVYHAKGMQDLKNFAGQCLGNYLENLIQHKFIVKKEAIPQEEEYLEALNDHQHANTIVVNAYSENQPDKPIPDPIREVVNVPAPPEVMGTFTQTDQASQMILGTFDAALGINDNQLSGVAVIEAATQSNAAAFPYLVGFLQAETQCANIMSDLIPKRMMNAQSLPVVSNEGERDYKKINGKNADGSRQPRMDYDERALNVEISAGVNYAIAKNRALQQIFMMMQASPTAAEFFSTEGFPEILENMEFHGSDIVKEKAKKWLEEKKSQPPQPSPEQMKMQLEQAKMQGKQQELMVKTQSKQQELAAKQQMHQTQVQLDILKLQQDQAKLMADLRMSEDQNYRENKRAAVEHGTKLHDQHLKHEDQQHKHNMAHHESVRKSVELHHQINQPAEGARNEETSS